MRHILILKSSILGNNHSHSNQLIDDLVDKWLSKHPHDTFRVRDLSQSSLPVLDNHLVDFLNPANQARLDAVQQQALALSDELITEIKQAEQIIIAAPTYNFMIPAQLKIYIDLITRAGITFRYTDNGSQGLLDNKKTIVIATRGGIHLNTPSDFVTPYLRFILGFIGLTDTHFIYAEGLTLGEETEKQAMETAQQQLIELLP